jgi:hypothetical protein
MARKLPRVRPGDVLRADDINRLYDEVRRLQLSVGSGGGLTMSQTPTGTALGFAGARSLWVKVTGNAAGAYAWVEQVPTGPGTWTDGPAGGTTTTDALREVNGNATIATNTIVRAWRAPSSGKILCQYDHC